jgi:hypothetical protein
MRLVRNVMFVVLVCTIAWMRSAPVSAQTIYRLVSWNTCSPVACSETPVPSCQTICGQENPPCTFSGLDGPPGCGNPLGRCQWNETYVFKYCSCDCPAGGGGGGPGGGGGNGCGGLGLPGDPCFFDFDCCQGYCEWLTCSYTEQT